MKFTACYTKLEDDYIMGQLLEWPNVLTSGKDMKDCQEMLKDAAREMAIAYYEDGMKIPQETLIIEPIEINIEPEALLENVG